MNERKGLILAGGIGSRLYPLTIETSKQLLPVYDKPMIYYPLSILMLSGIREIAIIVTPKHRTQYENLLGHGDQWGLSIQFIEQDKPEGIAQAYTLSKEFLGGSSSVLILGDNIFYGQGLIKQLKSAYKKTSRGTVFGYQVLDPERYGVVDFDSKGKVISIQEKPKSPSSNFAVTGLYFLDGSAPERVESITPSERGELEITDLINIYIDKSCCEHIQLNSWWVDAGTPERIIELENNLI